MGDAAHAMVPFYGQGMNCVSLILFTNEIPMLHHTELIGHHMKK